ncbi:mapk-regulated corepressor-interacting protein 1 isoform X2 [Ictidomys tridecemlineatus]
MKHLGLGLDGRRGHWHLSGASVSEAEGILQQSTRTRGPAMTSSPVSRVVYNGKRNSSPRSPTNSSEIFTPAHEENVRFIYEGCGARPAQPAVRWRAGPGGGIRGEGSQPQPEDLQAD